jgi:hypothetical protein
VATFLLDFLNFYFLSMLSFSTVWAIERSVRVVQHSIKRRGYASHIFKKTNKNLNFERPASVCI